MASQHTQDELRDLARACIDAKSAYWDALRAFELATAGDEHDGDWSDRLGDEVIDDIDAFAAGGGAADEDLDALVATASQERKT